MLVWKGRRQQFTMLSNAVVQKWVICGCDRKEYSHASCPHHTQLQISVNNTMTMNITYKNRFSTQVHENQGHCDLLSYCHLFPDGIGDTADTERRLTGRQFLQIRLYFCNAMRPFHGLPFYLMAIFWIPAVSYIKWRLLHLLCLIKKEQSQTRIPHISFVFNSVNYILFEDMVY